MNRRGLYNLLTTGDELNGLTASELAALKLPSIPAAIADYVSAAEYVAGPVSQVKLTFASLPITITDEAGVVAYGGRQILDFPAGVVAFQGALANLTVVKSGAGINATFDGDFGVGTVTASNNATLSATEQNIIPTTATPQAVAGATTAKGFSTATERDTTIDGTSAAVDAFLNFLIDDADQDGGGSLLVSGTLLIQFSHLGDY